MGDSFHIGFSLEYRYTGQKPIFCTIRIQKMKEILSHFDSLSANVQEFIIKTNKQCNNCRYCVQTDKTNTRPKAHVKVVADKTYLMCPYYAGYSYSFRDLTITEAKTIIEFIQVVEKYALQK